MAQSDKKATGSAGEDAAAFSLAKEGFDVIARNYRFGKFGEIDIIAREKEYICFIEVKTRKGNLFGTPSEAVGRRKQDRMKRLAWMYIRKCGLEGCSVRFDVVEVTGRHGPKGFEPTEINLIRNAF